LEILKDEFKILTGQTFLRNKMARKLSVFSSLISNHSFSDNFYQKIIIYLESLYNKLYFDIKFIWKYWKMNSKSWQDGHFHGTKWRENYQFYFDIKFIWKYQGRPWKNWKMNSNSWQDELFPGTKWRENYQCSCVWSRIIVLTLTSVKRWLYI
jgi:hypothetical protein